MDATDNLTALNIEVTEVNECELRLDHIQLITKVILVLCCLWLIV